MRHQEIDVGGQTYTRQEFVDRCRQYPGGLYFFTKAVMNRTKLKPHLHLPFANFIQLHPWNGGSRLTHRKGGWMPREHFKSTICSESFPLWLLACIDRNMTIALVSAKPENTKKWLRRIKDVIEYNGLFRWAFPHIRKGDKWDEQEIVVTRDRGFEGEVQASITAYSIGMGLASQHHDYIICDDLVNEQTAKSAVEMAKAVSLYHSLEEILKGWHDSRGFLVIGTPWGREDIIHEIKQEEKRGMRYIWGIGALGEFHLTEELRDKEYLIPDVVPGEPILPTECDMEKLEHIKAQGAEKYYLNYLCKPFDEGRNGFQLGLIRDYAELADGTLDCVCHPHHRHHLADGVTASVSDPAYTPGKEGCETAILIGNMQPCGCRFLMHEYGGHIQPPYYLEQAALLANRYRSWLNVWGVEDEALQVTLKNWLEEWQAQGKFPLGIAIHGLKVKNRQKDGRIAAAIPAVNQGLWHKPPGMKRVDDVNSTLQQLYQWPFSHLRDRADAFAYFEDIWTEFPPRGGRISTPGVDPTSINRRRVARDTAMMLREVNL
jgi:hypothetical protein